MLYTNTRQRGQGGVVGTVGAPDPKVEVGLPAQRFEPSAERWSPHRWTADLGPALVGALRRGLGGDPSERVAQRHGVVWTGTFEPSGDAAGMSDYAGFRGDPVEAVARISALRGRLGDRGTIGMATKLVSADGEVTDLVAMSLDVFPVARARGFLALLKVRQSGGIREVGGTLTMLVTGQASASALARAAMDERRRHVVDQTTFHGVHTFRLVRNGNGIQPSERRPFRYRWRPGSMTASPPPRSMAPGAPQDGRMRFDLELVLGDKSWPRLDDPTWRWPPHAPTVRAGTLTLDQPIEPEPAELAFNPLVLAPGLEPGSDELLSDRAGAYAVAHVARVQQHRRNRPEP
jgi:catalase